jgi:hypothetical protein
LPDPPRWHIDWEALPMDLAQLVAAALAATDREPAAADELRSFRDTVVRLLGPGSGSPGSDPVGPDLLRSRLGGLPAPERHELAAAARAVLARADPAGTAAGHYDLTTALPVAAGPADPLADPARHLTPAEPPPGDPAHSPPGDAVHPPPEDPAHSPPENPVGGSGREPSSQAAAADRARLALSVASPGHSAATVDVLRRMVAEAELRLGPRHPESLTARSDLAHGCQAAGRTAEAIAEMRSVAAARQAVLGDDHPDTRAARQALHDWTDGTP